MSNFKGQEQGAFIGISRDGIQQSTTINFQAWVPEDTNILSEDDGYSKNIRISEVRIGDEILSYDVKTDQFACRKVLNVHIKHEVPSYLLYCRGGNSISEIETLEATATFPVFVANKGWVSLSDLKAGDRIKSFDSDAFYASLAVEPRVRKNKELLVFGIKQTGNLKTMYGLELEDVHSYCVGCLLLWTHDGIWSGNENSSINVDDTSNQPEYQVGIPKIGGCSSLEYLLDGEFEIKELGDTYRTCKLMSRQVETGELRPALVRERIYHQRIELCDLYYFYNGESYHAALAYGQEVLMANGLWKRAIGLKSGDILESGSGNFTVVESLEAEWDDETDTMSFLSLMMDGDRNSNFCIGLHHQLCLRGFHFDEGEQV